MYSSILRVNISDKWGYKHASKWENKVFCFMNILVYLKQSTYLTGTQWNANLIKKQIRNRGVFSLSRQHDNSPRPCLPQLLHSGSLCCSKSIENRYRICSISVNLIRKGDTSFVISQHSFFFIYCSEILKGRFWNKHWNGGKFYFLMTVLKLMSSLFASNVWISFHLVRVAFFHLF